MKWLYNDHILNIGSSNSVQVKTKLNGHHRRITGLAFSNTLNVLVSSGADAQVTNIYLIMGRNTLLIFVIFLVASNQCLCHSSGATSSV